MKVIVKFYARFSDKFGKLHEFDLPKDSSVETFMVELKNRFPELKRERDVILSINDRISRGNEILREGDVISVFPPPGGG